MFDRPAGPLKLPPTLVAPTVEAARAVRDLRARPHSTSDVWLPEGLWDELDAVRAEHLRLRDQVASELTALEALDERVLREKREHDEKLRQATRTGDDPGSVEDRRTPPEQYEAERKAIEERLWAGIEVLAEVADLVPELAREHEDEWLADLRVRLVPAQEKVAELQRELARARREAFYVHKLGLWLQQVSDDSGAFARQPHPTSDEPVPAMFSEELLARSLERPWYRRPEHDPEHDEEPMVAWQDQQPESTTDVEPRADATGQISELVETGAGS
jgi:hypothetical protein